MAELENLEIKGVEELPKKEEASNMVQIIVFSMGGEEYALPIENIREVVQTPPISRIPLAPPYIKGVANVRGSILSIVSLQKKFGLDEGGSDESEALYILVVSYKKAHVGILVDHVPHTLSVPEKSIDDNTAMLQEGGNGTGYIKGIIKLEGKLLILLNIKSIVDTEKQN